MGTHPIFESDFDCLTGKMMRLARGSRRFLRYEQHKTHFGPQQTRNAQLIKAIGKNKMTEAEFFAWEYKKHCMLATGMYLLWTALCYDDKWDSISYLVKTGQAPAMYPNVPVSELKWTPFNFGPLG